MPNLVKINTSFPNAKEIKAVYADKYNPYSLSRYKRKSVLYDDYYHYSTMYPEDMNIDTKDYVVYVVNKSVEARLDILAYKFYGDSSLFWVIGYFNNIIDPFNVPVGTELKIPNKSSLYMSGGVL